MQPLRQKHQDAKTQSAGESHGGLNYHHFSKIGRRCLTGSSEEKKNGVAYIPSCVIYFSY